MKKVAIILSILVLLLGVTGFVVYKAVFAPKAPVAEETSEDLGESLPPVDASVKVEVAKSRSKDNTVVIKVSGMDSKMVSVGYELTYESEGLVKGVNSGSKPIETAGKDAFEREIYLGTCSRNVCKPDVGVTAVSVVLEFTDANEKRYQFSKEYDL